MSVLSAPPAPSYVHGASDVPLLGETIGSAFNRIVAKHGDAEALVSVEQGLRYSYGSLASEVNRAARALLARGIQKGDRVGLWSPNRSEWMIVQYATAKVGAILVNINPAYRLRELDYAVRQSGLSMLVAAPRFRGTDYLAMIDELRLADRLSLVVLGPGKGTHSWNSFLAGADTTAESALAAREAELEFDEAINIQYTSGTTGSPKGATLSHHNILNNGFFVGERLRLTPADRICLPVPFYHCFGMVLGNLAAMTHGAAIVLPGEAFEAGACLATIEAERCTALYGVPTMFIAQLQHPSFDRVKFDTLRTGIMAGSPCPVEVMQQVIDRMHMRDVTICYGMTETSPVSLQSEVDDPIDLRVSTVGAIHPHVEVKIVDPATGRAVPRGAVGELWTRGYVVMLGYWDNPEATHDAIDRSRWMHTGDLASMRDSGYVNIVGRIKDMVIRGGENVYPREIEEFLYTHPQIADVQVIGVPDLKYGEELCAWIRLKEGAAVSAEGIQAFCRGQIATHKIPRYFRFTTEFPMTVTGKIQKFKMRETSIVELGLESASRVQTA